MSMENNLSAWREAAGMSRETLAEQLGVTTTSVYRIERGTQQPRPSLLKRIASLFGRSPGDFWLEGLPSVAVHRVPILDMVPLVTAMAFTHNTELADTLLVAGNKPNEGSFAIRYRGTSMSPRFNTQDLALFDPTLVPRPGDFVFARDEEGKEIFKQYRVVTVKADGNEVFELTSLNPAYPTFHSESHTFEVKAVMYEHRWYRDSR